MSILQRLNRSDPAPLKVPVSSGSQNRTSRRSHKQLRDSLIAVFDQYVASRIAHLSPLASNVWMVIWSYALRGNDGMAAVGIETISQTTGRGKRRVQQAIAELIRAGAIERVRRGSLKGGPSVYRVLTSAEPGNSQKERAT